MKYNFIYKNHAHFTKFEVEMGCLLFSIVTLHQSTCTSHILTVAMVLPCPHDVMFHT